MSVRFSATTALTSAPAAVTNTATVRAPPGPPRATRAPDATLGASGGSSSTASTSATRSSTGSAPRSPSAPTATRASCTAYAMTIGATAGVDPESLVHSKFIILWACNIDLARTCTCGPSSPRRSKRGAKVVVIDPVRHRTAQRADWHIPIRPGHRRRAGPGDDERDHRRRADRRGLRRATTPSATTSSSSGSQQYTPEWAAEETGIPAEDIRTLAREYAAAQPSLIRIGVAIERHAGGGQTVRSIACLPALVGAWRHLGGGILQLPLWALPGQLGCVHAPGAR